MNSGRPPGPHGVAAARALGETVLVGATYVGVSLYAVANDLFGASGWFTFFTETEARLAGGFTTGALVQLLLVAILLLVPHFRHARAAVATLARPARRDGWIVAGIATVIQLAVVYVGWIRDASLLLDTSLFGLSMSAVPALDGVTQEIVFRGYVILRLAQAGIGRAWQIVVSGVLFASLHFSYGQAFDPQSLAGLAAALVPFFGTFGLGAAWAYAFQRAGNNLRPVVASHVVVLLLAQPWLAAAYGGG